MSGSLFTAWMYHTWSLPRAKFDVERILEHPVTFWEFYEKGGGEIRVSRCVPNGHSMRV